MKKKIYLAYSGCNRRGLDSQRLSNYLSKNNYKIISKPEEADYIIFTTCGATLLAIKDCFNKIKIFQGEYDAELIVAGCLPAIQPKQLAEIFKGKIILTEDLVKNPEKIDKLFPEINIKLREIKDTNNVLLTPTENQIFIKNLQRVIQDIKNTPTMDRKSTFVTLILQLKIFNWLTNHIINNFFNKDSFLYDFFNKDKNFIIRHSWGCTGNCSYCSIKKAVGPHISKSIKSCVNEFKEGINLGYTTFLLSGDDTGAYGIDNRSSFPELLYKIIRIKETQYEIEIKGLNPVWMVKYIDDLEKIVKSERILKISCPIQSASSRILKLMNRYSNVEIIKDAFVRLKKVYPKLKFSTHIIVGFPTETREDLEKTISFLDDIDFDYILIFTYVETPGAKSEMIEPKIPQDIIEKRLKYLKKHLKKEGYHSIFLGGMGAFYKK
jgi:tRNA A37 methylthiotransferase MiaB